MKNFRIRTALITDIKGIQMVRRSVHENMLSAEHLITDEDCKTFISQRGKGWVADVNNSIQGFAIIDLKKDNVWALFVHPDFEKKGIGKQLHNIMLNWYFRQGKVRVWLSTEQQTRAEHFYRLQGWREVGIQSNGELRFEMTVDQWTSSVTH
jgi:GNAT superfamily N-acetyltransferase